MKRILRHLLAFLGALLLIYLFAYIFIGDEVLALGEEDPLAPMPRTTGVFMQYFQGTLTANPDPIGPLIIEFSGLYSRRGLLSGESLLINSDGSFEFHWWTDIGSSETIGFIEVKNGQLLLVPFNSDDQTMLIYFMEEFSSLIPVRWGERRYMVPEAEIAQFCNFINGGYEPSTSPNIHFTFIHTEDKERNPGTLNEFPASVSWCILQQSVTGVIIELNSEHFTLNIGTNQGVFFGMRLYLVGPNSCVVVIDNVSEEQASGTYEGAHCGVIVIGETEFSSIP